MNKKNIRFASASVDFYFGTSFGTLKQIVDPSRTILITDQNVWDLHQKRFRGWKTIVVPPGEASKVQATVDTVINQLIQMAADRTYSLVGVGGGVVTDLTGYIASVYMRGIPFGFVPTTVLALVDASIGGKNGIDVGAYKNMVGVIRQPRFILQDIIFLNTLPQKEWANGFAEIIKHAAIANASVFRYLEEHGPAYFQKHKKEACALIQKNALLKAAIVQKDEEERSLRKLLNFGHTLGHAIENAYGLSHGEAISIGMAKAADISSQLTGFKGSSRLKELLQRYHLPVSHSFNTDAVIRILSADKKKDGNAINYILLEKIGKAVIRPIPIVDFQKYLS